ncbi:Uncharacterised protein family (UPF0259) [Serratia rubidaea]|uniref:UPF0259 membrane protein NCTC12971_03072 n=1 Tax=Serratia rubidaea TaxID=61652 RepID=A0A3S4I5X9_SERRU|nr:YciC family protein [Serratia rubidaea]MBD8452894.1 UPF0259 family protein [Serratia rubidaea]MBS0972884.1 UPF0259 family protein [Serratia rubidaea]MCR0997973.1 envelope biogenesis factor ElyC [Serratia rubidaea]MDC6110655.1 YciC family protein [Serratia rubidaea]MDK1702973.1 YciC family protein [Serratia rubidaea]
MSITANTVYRDSFNFFRNQLATILLLSLLTAFISILLDQAFQPDAEQLKILDAAFSELSSSAGMGLQEFVAQMTPEQQVVMLKKSAAATFAALVGNLLLVGGMLTLIRLVSQGQPVSALRAIGASAPELPRLLLLLFICTLLIQLGLTLFVVPGVIIAIAFSLAPVICSADKQGVFASLRQSAKLAFANARLIVPAMMLWLAAKLLVLLLVSHLSALAPSVAGVVLTALSNLVTALLLVYLFRLYMLLRH